ncbi:hypothetical protein WJX79_010803 [Trebouxia sp. C0005]
MDLTVIQQQVVFSSASVRGKAEALLLERLVYELSREEWRELIAGVPADIKRQIGMLKSAATIIDMPTEQEDTVEIEDGKEYPAILFGGRLDIDVLKDQLAQVVLILTKLDSKTPYHTSNVLSRRLFTATIIKAKTIRYPGRKSIQACLSAKDRWQLPSLVP